MRSHPVVGVTFLLAGVGLFVLGATARSAPAFLHKLPVAPEVAVPFVLWQLATWAALFGFFFLRHHTNARRGDRRAEASRRALLRV